MLANTEWSSSFVPGTRIEIINHVQRGRIHFALLDFDGTVSLIRQGWQGVMIPMMVEILLETPEHESEAELTRLVTDFVTRLTGRQTIYQMIELAQEVEKRGSRPLDPLEYKQEYLRRLWTSIKDRVTGLKADQHAPDDLTADRHDRHGLSKPGVGTFSLALKP